MLILDGFAADEQVDIAEHLLSRPRLFPVVTCVLSCNWMYSEQSKDPHRLRLNERVRLVRSHKKVQVLNMPKLSDREAFQVATTLLGQDGVSLNDPDAKECERLLLQKEERWRPSYIRCFVHTMRHNSRLACVRSCDEGLARGLQQPTCLPSPGAIMPSLNAKELVILSQLDSDGDGIVSDDELRAYLSRQEGVTQGTAKVRLQGVMLHKPDVSKPYTGINGDYVRTVDVCNGRAIYEKECADGTVMWWANINGAMSWCVGPRSKSTQGESRDIWASVVCLGPSPDYAATRPWSVYSYKSREWEKQFAVEVMSLGELPTRKKQTDLVLNLDEQVTTAVNSLASQHSRVFESFTDNLDSIFGASVIGRVMCLLMSVGLLDRELRSSLCPPNGPLSEGQFLEIRLALDPFLVLEDFWRDDALVLVEDCWPLAINKYIAPPLTCLSPSLRAGLAHETAVFLCKTLVHHCTPHQGHGQALVVSVPDRTTSEESEYWSTMEEDALCTDKQRHKAFQAKEAARHVKQRSRDLFISRVSHHPKGFGSVAPRFLPSPRSIEAAANLVARKHERKTESVSVDSIQTLEGDDSAEIIISKMTDEIRSIHESVSLTSPSADYLPITAPQSVPQSRKCILGDERRQMSEHLSKDLQKVFKHSSLFSTLFGAKKLGSSLLDTSLHAGLAPRRLSFLPAASSQASSQSSKSPARSQKLASSDSRPSSAVPCAPFNYLKRRPAPYISLTRTRPASSLGSSSRRSATPTKMWREERDRLKQSMDSTMQRRTQSLVELRSLSSTPQSQVPGSDLRFLDIENSPIPKQTDRSPDLSFSLVSATPSQGNITWQQQQSQRWKKQEVYLERLVQASQVEKTQKAAAKRRQLQLSKENKRMREKIAVAQMEEAKPFVKATEEGPHKGKWMYRPDRTQEQKERIAELHELTALLNAETIQRQEDLERHRQNVRKNLSLAGLRPDYPHPSIVAPAVLGQPDITDADRRNFEKLVHEAVMLALSPITA